MCGTPHLCVKTPFDVLIQCPGAACYRKCPDERAYQEWQRKRARLMYITQIESGERRQCDEEIDFRFGERPAVRDCGVNACCKREGCARDFCTSLETVIPIVSGFHRGLFL